MSAAAYNRGSRLVAQEADARAQAVSARVERQAHKDEADRLRAQVAKLERDLARARRCIAELRRSKDARMSEARAELASSRFAVSTLCRIAFPHDKT
jgi:phage shock protein A